MNLLLLSPDRVDAEGIATIDGEAVGHIIGVLGKGVGDTLRIGVLGGQIGSATIVALSTGEATLRCTVQRDPPPPSPVKLVLALPRPPMLRRSLAQATAMGVKHIHLIQTARVDKSYWSSPSLSPDKIDEQLRLGLTQAVDTVLPVVTLHRRFKPFAQDVLPTLLGGGVGLVADLVDGAAPVTAASGPVALAIGPEGGWVDFERELFAAAGLTAVTLGPRVLRVETAVVALLARLG